MKILNFRIITESEYQIMDSLLDKAVETSMNKDLELTDQKAINGALQSEIEMIRKSHADLEVKSANDKLNHIAEM